MKTFERFRKDKYGRVFSSWIDGGIVLSGNETAVLFFILGLLVGTGLTHAFI